jgi:crotonobetainyl-CoA:carnitine CoA-transferase CaiB-like acyl-CoA transferase
MNRSDSTPHGPLAGLKIVDLTSVLMGPYASQLLGEMGADVIKVEAPNGDLVRQIGPAKNAGMGPVFLNTNRSKRSIALNLKTTAGREVLMELVRLADVFLYNVRPQAMDRLGLTYEELREINPRLIYVGVFGYGQDGPYAARPAYDDLIQGASTLSATIAYSTNGSPQYVPLALVDRITGLSAVNATLAAVVERSRSGLGQRIDVPMFENMVGFVMADHMAAYTFVPPLGKAGYSRLLSPNRRPYKTLDGHICAMIYTDKQWRNFFRLVDREIEFDADDRMRSITTRTVHINDIYAELEAVMGTKTTADWMRLLEDADIPATPVHDFLSIFSDEHLTAINFFGVEEHPSEGVIRKMRHPNTWSRTQPCHARSIPRLGEDGIDVLLETGYSQSEIEELCRVGALVLPVRKGDAK